MLAEMQAVAAAATPPAELRLVYIPTACEIALGAPVEPGVCSGPPPADREALRGICDRLGIPLLDLGAPLAAAWSASPERGAHGEPVYFAHDGHWTALGHALVAREIERAWSPGSIR